MFLMQALHLPIFTIFEFSTLFQHVFHIVINIGKRQGFLTIPAFLYYDKEGFSAVSSASGGVFSGSTSGVSSI